MTPPLQLARRASSLTLSRQGAFDKTTWFFEARTQWRSILTKTTYKPRTPEERNQNEEYLCNQSGMFWLGTVWMYLCMYLNIVILLFFFVCRCLQTKGCIYGIGGWHNLNTNGLKEWLSNHWATWFERMNHTGVHLSCIMLPHFTHHVLHILYCTGTWIAWFTHHILYDYCIAGFSKYHCKVYSIYVNITLIPKNFDRYPQWWSGKYISFPSWVSPFQVGYTVYHGISCSLYSGLVAPFECYMYGHRLSRRMWRLKSLRNLGCDSCIFIAMKWTTFSTNNCLPLKLGLLPPKRKVLFQPPFFWGEIC